MWIAIALLAWLAECSPQENHPTSSEKAAIHELLTNPTFKSEGGGWLLRVAEYTSKAGHDASGAVVLQAERGKAPWSHAGIVLDGPPTERKLHFTCWLKSDGGFASVGVNAFAYDKSKETLGEWLGTTHLEQDSWAQYEADYVLDGNSAQFTLWVISTGSHDVLVSDAHLVAGEVAQPKLVALQGAGVLRVSAATSVRPSKEGQDGCVTFPIPNAYRGQIPLTFDLKVDPPEALKDFHWKERQDGVNVLCEVHLTPPANGAAVRWESLVYVPGGEPLDLPKAKEPVVPDEAKMWLKSTACVESADTEIVAKANDLAKDASDIEDFVKRVIAFTAQNKGKPGVEFDSLDARKALDCGGSCTSRANLAAALLRAHGIPARTVAHLPAWAERLYEHWLVEYWHPGVGWVWIEPTSGEMQPRPWGVAVLNVASPNDEEHGFDESIMHSGVMRGVPDWSVHKHSPELLNEWSESGLMAAGGNWAHATMRLTASVDRVKVFSDKAREAYAKLLANCRLGHLDRACTARVEAALSSKDIDKLEHALQP